MTLRFAQERIAQVLISEFGRGFIEYPNGKFEEINYNQEIPPNHADYALEWLRENDRVYAEKSGPPWPSEETLLHFLKLGGILGHAGGLVGSTGSPVIGVTFGTGTSLHKVQEFVGKLVKASGIRSGNTELIYDQWNNARSLNYDRITLNEFLEMKR